MLFSDKVKTLDNITSELSGLLSSIDNSNYTDVVKKSKPLIDKFKSLIEPNINNMDTESILSLLTKVDELKQLVTYSIIKHFDNENRFLHDELQNPLGGLAAKLRGILDKRTNPTRDVTNLIKLG